MQTQAKVLIQENKRLLQEITNMFPKPYNYAQRVVERLRVKGVEIRDRQQVYACIGGNTYNEHIAEEVDLLGKEYIKELIETNRNLTETGRQLLDTIKAHANDDAN